MMFCKLVIFFILWINGFSRFLLVFSGTMVKEELLLGWIYGGCNVV